MAELPLDQSDVELLVMKMFNNKMDEMVRREFCIERHKEVTTLSKRIESIDKRLWGMIILALVQVLGIAGLLFGMVIK